MHSRRGNRAHPRSRGENDDVLVRGFGREGSSPLTRGKRPGLGLLLRRPGLIPAHAGKTASMRRDSTVHWAHPRSRGENHGVQSRIVNQTGSSPLTRGKRVPPQRHGEAKGLIPAHAGKTRTRSARATRNRAHPRSRGENARPVSERSRAVGSSPLTRGKRVRCRAEREHPGLIPAHAGKTDKVAGALIGAGAHPRSRGENGTSVNPPGRTSGSSPLTRGKRIFRLDRVS